MPTWPQQAQRQYQGNFTGECPAHFSQGFWPHPAKVPIAASTHHAAGPLLIVLPASLTMLQEPCAAYC